MEKIAIIGCGLIGRGWVMVFARAGHAVKLHDSAAGAVEKACRLIREGLEKLRRAGLIAEEPDIILHRVTAAATLAEAVADADYVQENTAERLEVKRTVFRELDAAHRRPVKPDFFLPRNHGHTVESHHHLCRYRRDSYSVHVAAPAGDSG